MRHLSYSWSRGRFQSRNERHSLSQDRVLVKAFHQTGCQTSSHYESKHFRCPNSRCYSNGSEDLGSSLFDHLPRGNFKAGFTQSHTQPLLQHQRRLGHLRPRHSTDLQHYFPPYQKALSAPWSPTVGATAPALPAQVTGDKDLVLSSSAHSKRSKASRNHETFTFILAW